MAGRRRDRGPAGAGGGLIEGGDRLPLAALFQRAGVDPARGLSPAEAARHLALDGPNELLASPPPGPLRLALEQVRSVMVLVLLGAGALSFALGERLDAWAILAIVLVNVVLGVVQEHRAERAVAALARLGAPRARVLRSGRVRLVAAREVAVGDVVLLEAGDRVPADCRLIEAFAVQAEESALTGESQPVAKAAQEVVPPRPPGDLERPHMLLMGTTVVSGTARALVVRTGIHTELGAIARLVSEAPSTVTPLQRALEHLGRGLVLISAGAVTLVFLVGVLQGQPWLQMFLVAVSLAVAAIPEGLPAAVTAALALGVQRLSRRRAIVRRLSAVETLGCASVICSDKTGTLTRNEMTLTRIWTPWGELAVSGDGFAPRGTFRAPQRPAAGAGRPGAGTEADGPEIRPLDSPEWRPVLTALALSSRGDVHYDREQRRWIAAGDPTEAAVACAARKAGLSPEVLAREWVRELELPFEAQRRLASAGWRQTASGRPVLFVKGAPDALLERCTRLQAAPGAARELDGASRARIAAEADRLAGEGLRVLALAVRELEGQPATPAARASSQAELARFFERELTFLALMGLHDPPRPDVARAVATAQQAGVRTLMVTGDHPRTALVVAQAIGLAEPGEQAVLGARLAAMSEAELQEAARCHPVFARVAPAEKRRLVRALKEMGHVVAMTGDGVNDAPALKEADIGVAMGLAGTDVARQASAVILADDNYATIVAAIEEGRAIYENIRRFIRYLLGCNIGEVLTMLGAGVLGLSVPLSPLQLLWVNLVTDGLPALALGMLPASARLMRRPPRPRHESLFARGTAEEIAEQGLLIGSSTLVLFGLAVGSGAPLEQARTAAFTALVASQLAYALVCGLQADVGWRGMVPLAGAVLLSWLVHLAVIGLPVLQAAFATSWPAPGQWAAIAAASLGGTLGRYALDGAYGRVVGALRYGMRAVGGAVRSW